MSNKYIRINLYNINTLLHWTPQNIFAMSDLFTNFGIFISIFLKFFQIHRNSYWSHKKNKVLIIL